MMDLGRELPLIDMTGPALGAVEDDWDRHEFGHG
jgi:hypothetical protein